MGLYTPASVGLAVGSFGGRIDSAIKNGHPNAGAHPLGIMKDGRIWKQHYANGDTDIGRLSATIIDVFREAQLTFSNFSLSNHRVYLGEDTPESEELDTAFSWILAVADDGTVDVFYFEQDHEGFQRHLDEFDTIPYDNAEARSEHLGTDDSFSSERVIEPGEFERIGYLLGQVCCSKAS